MATPVFDPTQPFTPVEGETLDSLVMPKAAAPAAPAPSVPVFDPSQPFTPVVEPSAPAPAGPVFDPNAPSQKVYGLEDFKAKSAQDLIADKDFTPVPFGAQNLDALQNEPDQLEKLREVYTARELAGTTLTDKAKALYTGIAPALKTLGGGIKQAYNVYEKFTPAGIINRIKSGENLTQDYGKTGAEIAASVESAGLGTADLVRRSERAVKENPILGPAIRFAGAGTSAGSLTPQATPLSEQDQFETRQRLMDDIEGLRAVERAGAGNGEVMKALTIDADTLKGKGIILDPQAIQELSVITDPVNYIPIGSVVGAVTKAGGKAIRLGIAAAETSEKAAQLAKILNAASETASALKNGAGAVTGGAAKIVGGALEGAGNVAEKGVRALGGTASGVGLGGLLGGNVYSALGGAAVAKGVPRIAQVLGRTLKSGGSVLAGEAALSPGLALAGDALKAGALGAAKGAAEGALISLPFEIGARPEEEQNILGMVGVGALARGGIEGAAPVAKAGARAAQNKLAESIFKQVEQAPVADSPSYGTDAGLDSSHAANVAKLDPKEQKLVNWGRELLRGAGGEVYVLDNAAFQRETGSKSALGYAVNIGEKIAPDGSSTPVFRVLLNQSAEALPHEFFHALTDLDPKRAAEFRDTVQKSLTPEQLKSFEQLYNSRMNAGLPESQWRYRLTPEQLANEVTAETFSRLFLAQDLTGVAKPVQQKAALFVSGILEKLGAPLGGVNKPKGVGVSTLGVRPGVESTKAGQAWLGNMLQRVNETGTLGQPPIIGTKPSTVTPIPATAVSRKPAPAPAPTPAAPVPPVSSPVPASPVNPPLPSPAAPAPAPRNIRTPKAQQNDFASKRAAVTNTDSARKAAEATGDAATIARVNEISNLIESGSPVVEIEHAGAIAGGSEKAPSGRTARRAEQEAAYIAEGMGAAPEAVREAYQKVFVPVRWEIVAGKPQLLAMSLDKVLANAHKVVKEAAARGVEAKVPYEIVDGKLTDNAWGQFVDDLKAYAENQSNGYRGDGQKLTRPATDVGLSIPAENAAYNPQPISEERANFINMTQGLNPPLTAREGKQSSPVVPGNVKGQILAEVNARKPEVPATIRPEDLKKQEFKSQPGRVVMETNPLRNELSAAGVPIRELIEVTERINARDINAVKARPELDFKAPVTDTIRGGFLPSDEHSLIPVLETDDGQLFPGTGHADALSRAIKGLATGETSPEMLDKVTTAMENDAQHKFLDTKTGKVLDRAEAGQAVGFDGELQSEQLNKAATQKNLEAHTSKVAGQFMPSDNPRAVKQAAFLDEESGQIHRGSYHGEALVNALAKNANENRLVDGFVTGEGEFLTRQQALDRAVEIGQVSRPEYEKEVATYNDLSKEFGYGHDSSKELETVNFTRTKNFLPNPELKGLSDEYSKSAGLTEKQHSGYDEVPVKTAKKLADFYDKAKDAPNDPEVKASYQALAEETLAQAQALKDAGYMIEPYTGKGEPYKSSADMVADVRNNKHLFFLKTEGNFSGNEANPMLAPAGDGLVVNDVFRAVHDLFGHAKEGYQFGPRGEFNAWKAHSPMYSEAAQGALAAETLAQNSWVNFGKHLKEGTPLKDRPFAEQKNVVVPKELIDEARGQFLPTMAELEAKWAKADAQKKEKPTPAVSGTAWILPNGKLKALTASFHEQDLASNAAKYNKEFGTKLSDKADVSERLKALNAGFVRMRYEPNGGTMNVETGAGSWAKQKPKVLDALLGQSDKIDKLRMNLADKAGNLVDSAEDLQLFKSENKDADITNVVNSLVAPKTERKATVGPGDIQRARSFPVGGDFLPSTEKGKEWTAKGITFEIDAQPPETWGQRDFVLRAMNGDMEAGAVRGTIDGDGHAEVFQVEVEKLMRGQGLGETLYRELGAFLKSEGVKELGGDIMNPKALKLRKKVFPNTVTDNATFREKGFVPTISFIDKKSSFLPGEAEAPMLDLGLPSEEKMKQQRVKMRRTNAKESFPEALVPEYAKNEDGSFVLDATGKPKAKSVEYNLMDSPLAKEAAKGERGPEAREDAYTSALADKLVTAAKSAAKRKDLQAGAKWYSTTRTRLRGLLGDDSKFFSELLGATSARTPVDTNFRFSVDAYNQFKAGKFDSIIEKYREGKKIWESGKLPEDFKATDPTRGQFLDWWVEKNDLKPRQSNGKLFGANSRSVLRVLDGSWREEVQGPKTPNFAGNLSGDTFEATIDVWAARMLHRLSNEGTEGKRWRILPENETGVTDADFYLGQSAFRKAADKLGMKPDALQAVLWFMEKDHWEKKGWTRGAGAAKSDFNSLLSETERAPGGELRRKTPQNELAFSLGLDDLKAKK